METIKTAILGCITKYNISDIKPFVESINRSGFRGEKIMMVYEISDDVINYLKSNGWDVYGSKLQEHIIIQRFRDVYSLLNNYLDYRIIWVDVKDVVFQADPTPWLETNMTKELLAFSECVKLKDDSWAVTNTGTSFPLEWEWAQHNTSYCAGTIVGVGRALKDLFIDIYHWSRDTSNTGQLSDQAAYNILIHLNQYKDVVQFVNQEQGFITQLGTVLAKKDYFGNNLLEPTPIVTEDGVVLNQNGSQFCIVHQYDRIPVLNKIIIDKYK